MSSPGDGSGEDLLPAFCGLLPHPPIVVPAVGGARTQGCRPTLEACRELARRLVERRPGRLLMVSPHSPRRAGAFGLWRGELLRGHLGRFGAPDAEVRLANDRQLAAAVERAAAASGAATWGIPPEPLDHGATVPLWFLAEAGWQGPTTVVSSPWHASVGELEGFGRAVARAAAELGESRGALALVASGDMSHRCSPTAPAGFHPRAVEHDLELTARVRRGDLRSIGTLDPELREMAAEDTVEASVIVAAAIDYRAEGHEVLSYEHPFGVGYLVAVFHSGSPRPGRAPIDGLS